MKSSIISIWFPNQGINLGLLSKSLRHSISSIAEGIEINIVETYFEDFETFKINCEYESDDNLQYLIKLLHRTYGKPHVNSEVNLGDIVLGRLVNPGNVGFGIFVDIGVRPKMDSLLSLISLRNSLTDSKKVATRKIVKAYGFINTFPIECRVDSIDSKNNRINLSISEKYTNTLEDWQNLGLQKLLITKYMNYYFGQRVKELGMGKFIEEIEYVDPLTTIVTCSKRTNASGLLPILGPAIGSVPIGIFRPDKIALLHDSKA